MPSPESVFVEAPARLHFGTLDVRGDLGRKFGGLGTAISHPYVRLEVAAGPPDAPVTAEGPDAERAIAFAQRYLSSHNRNNGARITLYQTIPAHAGLGSTTQLALAIARALAELYGDSTEPAMLARAVGRGRYSAVGTWTFAGGGFVVAGSKRGGQGEHDTLGPLLARLPIPEHWRYVVLLPPGEGPLAGTDEGAALERMKLPERRDIERVTHMVLIQLLPALAEADLQGFGAALGAIQRITLRWSSTGRKGKRGQFATLLTRTLVEEMSNRGAVAVGQSAWGPAVYVIVDSHAVAKAVAARGHAILKGQGLIYSGTFGNRGHHVVATASPQDDPSPAACS